jgi:hypothetical protein
MEFVVVVAEFVSFDSVVVVRCCGIDFKWRGLGR